MGIFCWGEITHWSDHLLILTSWDLDLEWVKLGKSYIKTFPAGWSPSMVVRNKGTSPKSPKHSGLGIIVICLGSPMLSLWYCVYVFYLGPISSDGNGFGSPYKRWLAGISCWYLVRIGSKWPLRRLISSRKQVNFHGCPSWLQASRFITLILCIYGYFQK